MDFAEVRQTLLRDFEFCVEREQVPPLSTYLPTYVKTDGTVAPEDYRLLPLTAGSLRFASTSSSCLTDCLLDLQAKYQHFIPDGWGGRMERGSRDIGVIGFNILEGVALDIVEINQTSTYLEWAETRLAPLYWERLLIHAVVAFGRSCQAQEVRLQPAHRYSGGVPLAADPAQAARIQEALRQTYDASAEALGFDFDQGRDCFVLKLGTP